MKNGNGNGRLATMRDVAELVGVSQATVSYVLNAKKNARVSPETRERVLEAAASLQYQPNAIARAMALGRSRTVGVYQPHVGESPLSGMWTTLVMRGIGEELHEHGYHLLLFGYRQSDDPSPSAFLDGRVDGLIVLAPHVSDSLPMLLSQLNFPTAIVGGHAPPGDRMRSVDVDNRTGARAATAHLISLGHQRIAHLKGPATVPNAVDRVSGYLEALEAAGIEARPDYLVDAGFHDAGGYMGAMKALCASPRPTGIVAANDISAVGALRACKELGLRVPQDVAVIGYDDAPVCELTSPKLTTMRQPAVEMGRAASRMLLNMRGAGDLQDAHRSFAPDLIVRESCGSLLESTGRG